MSLQDNEGKTLNAHKLTAASASVLRCAVPRTGRFYLFQCLQYLAPLSTALNRPQSLSNSSVPSNMRAVSIEQCGGPEVLVVSDVPAPSRKEGEVLIKAVSAGVNPVDLLVATGAYKPAQFPKVRSANHTDWMDLGSARTACRWGPPQRRRRQPAPAAAATVGPLVRRSLHIYNAAAVGVDWVQILGGDVSGIVEEAGEGSKVGARGRGRGRGGGALLRVLWLAASNMPLHALPTADQPATAAPCPPASLRVCSSRRATR